MTMMTIAVTLIAAALLLLTASIVKDHLYVRPSKKTLQQLADKDVVCFSSPMSLDTDRTVILRPRNGHVQFFVSPTMWDMAEQTLKGTGVQSVVRFNELDPSRLRFNARNNKLRYEGVYVGRVEEVRPAMEETDAVIASIRHRIRQQAL